MIPSQKVGVVTSEMVRYSLRTDTEADFITHTMALIKKMVKFGYGCIYEKRKVMKKVQNFRHFPRNLGRWSRTRRRIMDTFNDWYNAINAEHRWRWHNHCHNGRGEQVNTTLARGRTSNYREKITSVRPPFEHEFWFWFWFWRVRFMREKETSTYLVFLFLFFLVFGS